ATSSARYGEENGSPTARVERTFDDAVTRDHGDCYLAILEGANHFSFAHPLDDSTGRPFIDMPTTSPDTDLREIISELTRNFVLGISRNDPQAIEQLHKLLLNNNSLITRGDRR
ncbi:MAG: hypothetical protein ABJN62_07005, partial [Halioglobus sp.]